MASPGTPAAVFTDGPQAMHLPAPVPLASQEAVFPADVSCGTFLRMVSLLHQAPPAEGHNDVFSNYMQFLALQVEWGSFPDLFLLGVHCLSL